MSTGYTPIIWESVYDGAHEKLIMLALASGGTGIECGMDLVELTRRANPSDGLGILLIVQRLAREGVVILSTTGEEFRVEFSPRAITELTAGRSGK